MKMVHRDTGQIVELATPLLPEGFILYEDPEPVEVTKQKVKKGWQKVYYKTIEELHAGMTGKEVELSYFILAKLTKTSNEMRGTITSLAKEFRVTRAKMSQYIKKMKEKGLVKGEPPFFTVNPFIRIPYGADGDTWIRLQKEWQN